MSRTAVTVATSFLVLSFFTALSTVGQHPIDSARPTISTRCVVVPQCGVLTSHTRPSIVLQKVDARVAIVEQAATTTLDLTVHNPTARAIEAELALPVPDGAVVRSFAFQGSAKKANVELLSRGQAQAHYESIVRRLKDPALLEFLGHGVLKSSVFPVEPGKTQTMRVVYETLLPADGHRVDYILPRSESVAYSIPWDIAVDIRSKQPLATAYSPSHRIDVSHSSAGKMSIRLGVGAGREPGAFRLSYLKQDGPVTASLFTYPKDDDGGYFLLLAGVPADAKRNHDAMPREVTVVIDRSGSMRGEKLEQAREAATQIIHGLRDGEAFNVIVYNNEISRFASQPVVKNGESAAKAEAWLKKISATGGTNLHGALVEALAQPPTKKMLPLVLFLTDGLPTVGVTGEVAIRKVATDQNPYRRRVFTFGVGVDVNSALLDKIAVATRARPTFVLPKENVEAKVGSLFKRLAGPVLTTPKLDLVDAQGEVAMGRVVDVFPATLGDVFEDDQIVVIGRYFGKDSLRFRLRGHDGGRKPRTFAFDFSATKSSRRNAFVPRLWASRRIGRLLDEIRQQGETYPATASVGAVPTNPRFKELTEEVVQLSKEFGILTEYTAFLARDGVDLNATAGLNAVAAGNFEARALNCRTGLGSVTQELNNGFNRMQVCANPRNGHWNAQMQWVETANVQQTCDLAFFRQGTRWVDSRLLGDSTKITSPKVPIVTSSPTRQTIGNTTSLATNATVQNAPKAAPTVDEPDRVVTLGSDEHFELARKLVARGRQGAIALRGEILIEVDGERILVRP